jgi:hypothetical protein
MKKPTPMRKSIAAALAALVLLPAAPAAELIPLFDGKSLDGWEVRSGTATYKVEDGTIVGTTTEGSPNTFLCTKQTFGDFILEFEVKCDPELNSGVQIRSEAFDEPTEIEFDGKTRRLPAGRVFGYQVEISANRNPGRIYDEARRGTWLDVPGPPPEAAGAFRIGEWNHYRVIAQGDRIRTFINGVPIADIRDSTTARGFIGLQVHGIKKGAGPFSVRWRNIGIRELQPGEEI